MIYTDTTTGSTTTIYSANDVRAFFGIPVSGVSLNKTTDTIIAGNTDQLTATVAPANATNTGVSWASDNTAVATVSSTGLVTAVSKGTVQITVTTADGSKTATCTVTVTTLQPTVTLDDNVIYDTSNTAYVNMKVLGTFIAPTGYQLSECGFVSLKNPASDPGTSLTLSTSGATILKATTSLNAAGQVYRIIKTTYGATFYVRGYMIYTDTTTGSTTTIYSANDVRAFFGIPVSGVSLNKTTDTIIAGNTDQLTAAVAPANATNTGVSWASDNTAVATVSSTGLVTAVSKGTAQITVTTADGSKTATCTVTVTTLQPTVTLDDNVIYDTSNTAYVNMKILGTFIAPTGYQLSECGFVSLKNPASDPGTSLTLSTSGATILKATTSLNAAGQVYRIIKTTYGATFYVRGYMIYTDTATGSTTTIYSPDVVKAVKTN